MEGLFATTYLTVIIVWCVENMVNETTIFGNGQYAIAAEYLIALQEIVSEHGVLPKDFLKGTNLPLNILIQPQAKIGQQSMVQAVSNAITLTKDPYLAIFFGKRLVLSRHGAIGHALKVSETLAAAAALLVQYIDTRAAAKRFEYHIDEGFACLRVLPISSDVILSDESYQFFVLSNFYSLEGHIRWVLGRGDDELPITFCFDYECPIEIPKNLRPPGIAFLYSQPFNELRMPLALVTEPLPLANEELFEAALVECQSELVKIKSMDDVVFMVRLQIRESQGRMPSVEQLAETLGLSSRTLKRRLNNAGTTFQKIKDSERFSTAVHLLAHTSRSVEDIADTLGYSDGSNFNKAFKGWVAMSPREYRESVCSINE